jgi:hypothetical protein
MSFWTQRYAPTPPNLRDALTPQSQSQSQSTTKMGGSQRDRSGRGAPTYRVTFPCLTRHTRMCFLSLLFRNLVLSAFSILHHRHLSMPFCDPPDLYMLPVLRVTLLHMSRPVLCLPTHLRAVWPLYTCCQHPYVWALFVSVSRCVVSILLN